MLVSFVRLNRQVSLVYVTFLCDANLCYVKIRKFVLVVALVSQFRIFSMLSLSHRNELTFFCWCLFLCYVTIIGQHLRGFNWVLTCCCFWFVFISYNSNNNTGTVNTTRSVFTRVYKLCYKTNKSSMFKNRVG